MSTFAEYIASVRKATSPNDSQLQRAAYDFRSDTLTVPTERMLQAMTQTTLGDATFNEDEVTSAFEAHISKLLGHEAGLFVSSGTAGNQIALRVHLTQPPHSVLCDGRSHVYTSEAGGMATLSQALAQPVMPEAGRHLTLEDVQKAAVLEEDIHYAPTRVISLENTLGGTIMSLDEIKRIREFAKANGLKMHLDGARLWNACADGTHTFSDYGRQFDSVSVCFSKGLGAPVGSMLVGSKAFIKKATWVRKSIGGGMRQTGTIAAAAWTAVDEVYPLLPQTHAIAKDLETYFVDLGLKIAVPVHTNMVFLDLESAGLKASWIQEEASKRGIKCRAQRFVVHHQICPEAVAALKQSVEVVLKKKAKGGFAGAADGIETTYGTIKK